MKKLNLLTAVLVVGLTAGANSQATVPDSSSATGSGLASNEDTPNAATSFNGKREKPRVRTKIVKFARGKTSAVYEEDLPKGGVYKFVGGAKKNQLMAIRVATDSGDVTFDVKHNGKTIPASVDADKWSDKLSSGGDYQINVKRKSGSGKFLIEISLE